MSEKDGIDIDFDVPVDDRYVLVSFSNFSVPSIGRYVEGNDGGGLFYCGDTETSYISEGLIVNGWMPLPECMED